MINYYLQRYIVFLKTKLIKTFNITSDNEAVKDIFVFKKSDSETKCIKQSLPCISQQIRESVEGEIIVTGAGKEMCFVEINSTNPNKKSKKQSTFLYQWKSKVPLCISGKENSRG